jgi:hypothetical protein
MSRSALPVANESFEVVPARFSVRTEELQERVACEEGWLPFVVHSRAVTAPSPVRRLLDDAGTNRIQKDISAGLE